MRSLRLSLRDNGKQKLCEGRSFVPDPTIYEAVPVTKLLFNFVVAQRQSQKTRECAFSCD
jgi:hypothetical protein